MKFETTLPALFYTISVSHNVFPDVVVQHDRNWSSLSEARDIASMLTEEMGCEVRIYEHRGSRVDVIEIFQSCSPA